MDDNSWGDEFEVEVTDLRTGQRANVPPPATEGRTLPIQPRAVPLDDGLSPTPVVVSRPPSAGRRRGLIVASALTLLALALFLLPGSPLSVNRVVVSSTPTKTAAISSSDATFFMVHAVPWGTLKVDGKETTAIQNGSNYANVTLAAGTHTIEYSAPPFPAIHCQVSVPTRGADNCPTDQHPNDLPNLPDPNARVLDLRANIANLPAGAMSALTVKVEESLKTLGNRAQLQVGDHYLDASGTIQVASANMLGIASYGLATNVQQQPGCSAICDEQGMGAGPDGPAWVILASLVENWRYLLANGPAISGPQLGQNGAPLQRVFGVTWNGSWQVSSLDTYSTLSCESGNNALAQDISSVNPNFYQSTSTQQTSADSSGHADGCVISIAPTNNSGTPSAAVAYFLYRCGALIAVNPAAQALLPSAPAPSAHEQQLATQLISTIAPQS